MLKRIGFAIILLCIATTMLCVSCGKADGNDNIVNTSWRSESTEYGDNFIRIIHFATETSGQVTVWCNGHESEPESFTYIYHAPEGTIYAGAESHHFTIDGNVLVLTIDGLELAFVRQ